MEHHVLVVLTNAVEGQDEAFNDWYTNTHLKDVLAIPGVKRAQRFRLSDAQREGANLSWRYLALYEIETDDAAEIFAELKKRAGTPALVMTDAMARDASAMLFKPITPMVEAAS